MSIVFLNGQVSNKIKIQKNILKTNCFVHYRYCCIRWYTLVVLFTLVFGLVVMQPLTWFQFFWTKYRGLEQPRNQFLRYVYDISENITKSAKIRTAIYLLISFGLAATSMVNVMECVEIKTDDPEVNTVLSNCVSSWVISFSTLRHS